MAVFASILLAAVVGGIVFMLLDNWQRRAAPAVAEPPRRPEPAPATLFHAPGHFSTPPPAHEARTEPLPPPRVSAPPPERHLWDDPTDEEDRPPGLWSGWAR
jgi:hypothetical protein